MDTKHGSATRLKLMETARELFIAKGVDRVGVREIATKAGVNLSLMNYYFRSKENLLEEIFEQSIKDNGQVLRGILNEDLPLEEKIYKYVNTYIDILTEDPLLVPFVLSIIHRNAEQAPRLKAVHTLYNTETFSNQLKHEAEVGKIRKIDPEQFFISMISLILFPFAIKWLIGYRMTFTPEQMAKFLEDRREHVYDMLINSLRP
ncbi:MAG: TetR/AcrR family transcriptional regulator [Tenuifilum sp.]|jgi:AcrR family transcriptional regulator|uniref:TetR/AcrR family transcriptional regulator n=1 Tax=Tenuifilum sp. TaxID=2760880 RepID=UPI0024ABE01A|nr:TetR/AcrR family transcriptional regulator [Tenuifilum sp.]MDI3527490.1 TetR/AcrR family transcriptional regulator [Tenuifilum sp.]